MANRIASPQEKGRAMKEFLASIGITDPVTIIHNPSYDELFAAETDDALTGFEKGHVTKPSP